MLRRRLLAVAPVSLTVAVGLLVGIGVTYVALRPDPSSATSTDGAPSVQTIDRPARPTAEAAPSAEAILAEAAAAASTVAVPVQEPASARAALTQFLEAERADRSDESFALLSADVQRSYGSIAAWRQSRSDRAIPATFAITGERRLSDARTEVIVAAGRAPSITPFRGFVPAQSTERWILTRSAETGWRLLRPTAAASEPQLPPDAAARAAADRWVALAAACEDGPPLFELQLAPDLLGATDLSGLACEAGGTWSTAEAALPVAELPDVTAFVAAFGPSVGRWGRAVAVTNGDQRMTVVLGPIGEAWRVLGLTTG